MHKIVYYVATSLDGFISGPNGDISAFKHYEEPIRQYKEDLSTFKTVIMGRNTYEFGYKYGLQPGQPAYPNMTHHVFSNQLELKNKSDQIHIEKVDINRIKDIKKQATTDVYLCGGGHFAGWLLDNHLIDQLKLKLNPILLGEGIRLFGKSKTQANWTLKETLSFDAGLQFLTYDFVL